MSMVIPKKNGMNMVLFFMCSIIITNICTDTLNKSIFILIMVRSNYLVIKLRIQVLLASMPFKYENK